MLNINQFHSAIRSGMAKTSLYKVDLPYISGTGILPGGLNLMCRSASLPGKQIMTGERMIGVKMEKVVNGFAVDDVALTFYLTNDYEAKRYFEAWAALSLDPDTYELNYKYGPNGYAKDVTITQLNQRSEPIYVCKLKDAFPTTINPIEFSSNEGSVVELNVQLSYSDWSGEWLSPYTPFP